MEASEVTRPSLVLRIRDHDDGDSWTEFVQLYGGLIHYYCIHRGLQEEDAAEVTQDVLLQISQSITRFEYQPARGRFRSWLATLTKSKMVELLRKKGRRHEVLTTFEEMEPTGTLDGVWCDAWNLRLTEAAMRQVKSCMSADTFDAFHAAWIDQQEPASIAKLHNKDLAWVYVCKSRGLKLLRKIIIELADEMPDEDDLNSAQHGFSPEVCEDLT
jgi:RNA polymerase sigma-70 factor (ECF subfamily)